MYTETRFFFRKLLLDSFGHISTPKQGQKENPSTYSDSSRKRASNDVNYYFNLDKNQT